MIFSSKSNVTLVITSCNRFDLLKKTLESFSKNNTYPIKEIIIIEDSGNPKIRNIIPNQWLDNTKLIINEKNLGQIKSIDLAYQEVKTDYIFHCEDDWLFYRNGFIEDSMKILESDKSILTVWLRDIEKDIEKNYPFHYVFDEKTIDKISFYQLGSENPDWRGFTFNPTLKRKSDYKKLIKYLSIKLKQYRKSNKETKNERKQNTIQNSKINIQQIEQNMAKREYSNDLSVKRRVAYQRLERFLSDENCQMDIPKKEKGEKIKRTIA